MYLSSGLILTCRQTRIEMLSTALFLYNRLPWTLNIAFQGPLKMEACWEELPVPPTARKMTSDGLDNNMYKHPQMCTALSPPLFQAEGCNEIDLVARYIVPAEEAGNQDLLDSIPFFLVHLIGAWCEYGIELTAPVYGERMNNHTTVQPTLGGHSPPYINTLTIVVVPVDDTQPITKRDLIARYSKDIVSNVSCPRCFRDLPWQYGHFRTLQEEIAGLIKSGLLWGYIGKIKLEVEGRDASEKVEDVSGIDDGLQWNTWWEKGEQEAQHEWTVYAVEERKRKAMAKHWAPFGWILGYRER